MNRIIVLLCPLLSFASGELGQKIQKFKMSMFSVTLIIVGISALFVVISFLTGSDKAMYRLVQWSIGSAFLFSVESIVRFLQTSFS